MRVKIYQAYYLQEQLAFLEDSFIPFDNTANEYPDLREYPLMQTLFALNEKDTETSHWGMVSWRWREKVGIPGDKFIDWMLENSGYDIYNLNPYNSTLIYNNSFVQGEIWRPGMLQYTNSLLRELGYYENIETIVFPINILSYCNFYFGNQKFWREYLSFCEKCIAITKQNHEMNNYMFLEKLPHRESLLINFSFVIERLPMLFLYLNMDKFKVKHYPYL